MRRCIWLLATATGLWGAADAVPTDPFQGLRRQPLAPPGSAGPARAWTTWRASLTGPPSPRAVPEVVDARAARKPRTAASRVVADIALSRERSREGRPSLRMRLARPAGRRPGPKNGRGWGSAGVRRQFDGRRLETVQPRLRVGSIPGLPRMPGRRAGAPHATAKARRKLPAVFGQEGETTVVLQNNEWNHVVWEDRQRGAGSGSRALRFSCLDFQAMNPRPRTR
jgi:hypothetical protein